MTRLPSGQAALVAVLTALVALAPGPTAAVAGPDCTPAADWGAPRSDLAGRVVALTNEHRARLGLGPVAAVPALTRAAEWKARHMARHGYLGHDDPPPVGRTAGQRLAACGYPADRAGFGENLAVGQPTPEAVLDAWITSPVHRANLEQPWFTTIGVGVAADHAGALHWAQAFGTTAEDVAGVPAADPVPPGAAPAAPAAASAAPAGAPAGVAAAPPGGRAGAGGAAPAGGGTPGGPGPVIAAPGVLPIGPGAGDPAAALATAVEGAAAGAPRVVITRRPPATTTARTVRVAWTVSGAPVRTTCRLDRRRSVACRSPLTLRRLRPGRHTLRVQVRISGERTPAVVRLRWTTRPAGARRR